MALGVWPLTEAWRFTGLVTEFSVGELITMLAQTFRLPPKNRITKVRNKDFKVVRSLSFSFVGVQQP
jgi:hypothetical protein